MVLQSYKFKIKDTIFIVVGTENVRKDITIDTVKNTNSGERKKYNRLELLEMIEKYNGKFI